MDQPIHPSSIGYKKENFRKQIRREKINQQFASRRKMLFRDTLALTNPQTHQQQILHLTSWQQVMDQLTSFIPDYCAIHLYINAHHENGMPQEVERLIVSLVHRPEFLTNEDSLALLVTLTLVRNKDDRSIFEPGVIKLIVDNLLKWSVVEVEVGGRVQMGVNYFETVCWTLYSFASICENDKEQVFETFRQKRQMFEKFANEPCYQQITLFAQLSTLPSFLPSTQFIQRIIRKSLEPQSCKSDLTREIMVCLLDNFMRYKQQNPHRFEVEDNKELTELYFEFIYKNLEDSSFSKARRVELIGLLTTLINSVKESTLHGIFGSQKAMRLFGLIYNSSQYQSWQIKKASLICITTIMTNPILLPYLIQRISPHNLAHLCYESLNLPDPETKKLIVATVLCLCCLNAKAFIKEFRRYNLSGVIKRMEYEEINGGGGGQEMSLSEYVAYMDEYVRVFEQNMDGRGDGVGRREHGQRQGENDVEI